MKNKILILIAALLPCAAFCAPPGPQIPGGVLVTSAAYEASHVIKAAPGTLITVFGYNSGGAQFIQVHDATALPADTGVPKITFAVAAASNFYLDVPATGMDFGTGIVVCNSTTGPTKTIGSANCWFVAIYR